MQRVFLIIIFFISAECSGQTLQQQLQHIETYDDAQALVDHHPGWQLDMLQLNACIDTSARQKQFYLKKKGDIFEIGNESYKVLYDTSIEFSRVNYIFLDGNKMTKNKIDSIRNLIIREYKNGIPFDSLSVKYNMDGNSNFGDTNWYSDGLMIKEFQQAVLKHKQADIFTIDVNSSAWYYVVKKTFATSKFKQMAIIRVKQGE